MLNTNSAITIFLSVMFHVWIIYMSVITVQCIQEFQLFSIRMIMFVLHWATEVICEKGDLSTKHCAYCKCSVADFVLLTFSFFLFFFSPVLCKL